VSRISFYTIYNVYIYGTYNIKLNFLYYILSYKEFAESNWWGFPKCIFSIAPIISYEFDFKDGNDYYWLPQVHSLVQEYRNLKLSTQDEDALNNWLSTKNEQTVDRFEDAFFRHKQLMNTEFSILYKTQFEPEEWIKMIESKRNDSSGQSDIDETKRTPDEYSKKRKISADEAIISSSSHSFW